MPEHLGPNTTTAYTTCPKCEASWTPSAIEGGPTVCFNCGTQTAGPWTFNAPGARGKWSRVMSVKSDKSFYERFVEELEALTIMGDDPAAHVVGLLTRAAKRAQMVFDGDIDPVADRG